MILVRKLFSFSFHYFLYLNRDFCFSFFIESKFNPNPKKNMNATTIAKVKTLFDTIAANYRARGDSHPEVAANFQVEIALKIALSQPEFTDMLLDYEIEDTIKAGQAIARA